MSRLDAVLAGVAPGSKAETDALFLVARKLEEERDYWEAQAKRTTVAALREERAKAAA